MLCFREPISSRFLGPCSTPPNLDRVGANSGAGDNHRYCSFKSMTPGLGWRATLRASFITKIATSGASSCRGTRAAYAGQVRTNRRSVWDSPGQRHRWGKRLGLGGVREGAASEGEPGRVCFLPSMTPYPPTPGLRRVLLSSLTIPSLLEVSSALVT